MAETIGDDRTTALPDGTDTVIEGAATTVDDARTTTAEDKSLITEGNSPASSGGSTGSTTSSGGPERNLADRIRDGREQFTAQAGERTRGIVTQGLERTSEALANVAKMVGDTAPGIEERLGAEYGDYARRAAGAIENVANNIAEKDPDELIDDTRTFVRNSPGIALAGAAVVGFVVARLIKSGIGTAADEDDDA